MNSTRKIALVLLAGTCGFVLMVNPSAQPQPQEDPQMGFFITSVGIGDGGNLGGLEGADAHCQQLAETVGAGHRTWRAYLSTQEILGTQETEDEPEPAPAVHARDRIGEGPWYNAHGMPIAVNLDDLHYNNANIHYEYALNEQGETVNSGALGDQPNMHDILTGSYLDGRAFPPDEDRTCRNWTSNDEGSAWVGHHDRFSFMTPGDSWNSSHGTLGCSQEAFEQTGGAGLFYCFAID